METTVAYVRAMKMDSTEDEWTLQCWNCSQNLGVPNATGIWLDVWYLTDFREVGNTPVFCSHCGSSQYVYQLERSLP